MARSLFPRLLLSAAISGCLVQNAIAEENVGVSERARPEYDPQGIPLGPFIFRPTLGVQGEHNDNVLATPDQTRSDFIFHLQPKIALTEEWGEGEALSFDAHGRINRYASISSEDTDEYGALAKASMIVLANTSLHASAGYSHEAVSRQSELSPSDSVHPIEYNTGEASIALAHDFGEWHLIGRGEWQRFSYQNGVDGTGTEINEKSLNYELISETLRAEYAISPDTALFVAGQWTNTSYDKKPPLTLYDRESNSLEVTGGLHFHATEVIEGDISAGYLQADYPHIAGQNVNELAAHASLSWYPTLLTTVTIRFDRTLRESALQFSAGYLDTGGSVRIDHELRRDVILNAHFDYSRAAYQGVDRNDDVWRAGVGAKYLISNQMNLGLSFDHEARKSVGTQRFANFDANRITLSLNFQL